MPGLARSVHLHTDCVCCLNWFPPRRQKFCSVWRFVKGNFDWYWVDTLIQSSKDSQQGIFLSKSRLSWCYGCFNTHAFIYFLHFSGPQVRQPAAALGAQLCSPPKPGPWSWAWVYLWSPHPWLPRLRRVPGHPVAAVADLHSARALRQAHYQPIWYMVVLCLTAFYSFHKIPQMYATYTRNLFFTECNKILLSIKRNYLHFFFLPCCIMQYDSGNTRC